MIKYKHAPLLTFKLCVEGEKPLQVRSTFGYFQDLMNEHDKDGHTFTAYQATVNYDGSITWTTFATND